MGCKERGGGEVEVLRCRGVKCVDWVGIEEEGCCYDADGKTTRMIIFAGKMNTNLSEDNLTSFISSRFA